MLKYNLIDKRKQFCWNEWLPQTEHDINEVIKTYKEGLREQISVKEAIGDLLKENGIVPTPNFKSYESGVYGEITNNYQELMRKGKERIGRVRNESIVFVGIKTSVAWKTRVELL